MREPLSVTKFAAPSLAVVQNAAALIFQVQRKRPELNWPGAMLAFCNYPIGQTECCMYVVTAHCQNGNW